MDHFHTAKNAVNSSADDPSRWCPGRSVDTVETLIEGVRPVEEIIEKADTDGAECPESHGGVGTVAVHPHRLQTERAAVRPVDGEGGKV